MESNTSVDDYGIIRYTIKNGKFHRTDGPAYESPCGLKVWYINGLCHREDGPARIHDTDVYFYYLYGNMYSKEDWKKEVIKMKLDRLKNLQI